MTCNRLTVPGNVVLYHGKLDIAEPWVGKQRDVIQQGVLNHVLKIVAARERFQLRTATPTLRRHGSTTHLTVVFHNFLPRFCGSHESQLLQQRAGGRAVDHQSEQSYSADHGKEFGGLKMEHLVNVPSFSEMLLEGRP